MGKRKRKVPPELELMRREIDNLEAEIRIRCQAWRAYIDRLAPPPETEEQKRLKRFKKQDWQHYLKQGGAL